MTESDGESVAFVWMFIMLGLLFLPITSIWRFCSRGGSDEFERYFGHEPEYKKEAIHFVEDYNRSNPVTEEDGNKEFKELIRQNAEQDDDEKLKAESNKILNALVASEEATRKSMGESVPSTNISGNLSAYAGNMPSIDHAN